MLRNVGRTLQNVGRTLRNVGRTLRNVGRTLRNVGLTAEGERVLRKMDAEQSNHLFYVVFSSMQDGVEQ